MKKTDSVSLIQRLISDPSLVQAIRKLDSSALVTIIDQLGLEDSGPLIALSSTKQLAGMFDRDLWKNDEPGKQETFDPERFSVWLYVLLNELGPDATAVKLLKMDPDFLTYALSEQVYVLNVDQMAITFSQMPEEGAEKSAIEKLLDSSPIQEFGEYAAVSKRKGNWDALVSLFLALDSQHQHFFRKLLERLEYISNDYIEDNGGLFEVLLASEQIENDVSFERGQRLEGEGLIPPVDAKMFLDSAANGTEDPVTRMHLKTFIPKIHSVPTPADIEANEKLYLILEEAEVIPKTERKLITGATETPGAEITRLLGKLAEQNPKKASEHLQELAYLANILVAGYSPDGKTRMRPADAAELAIETVAKGCEIFREMTKRTTEDLIAMGTMVEAFREGWKSTIGKGP